eukprot:gene44896-6150_t
MRWAAAALLLPAALVSPPRAGAATATVSIQTCCSAQGHSVNSVTDNTVWGSMDGATEVNLNNVGNDRQDCDNDAIATASGNRDWVGEQWLDNPCTPTGYSCLCHSDDSNTHRKPHNFDPNPCAVHNSDHVSIHSGAHSVPIVATFARAVWIPHKSAVNVSYESAFYAAKQGADEGRIGGG